jgi:hypothetical protein
MSDENIIRGCGCSPDEACNLCGFEACQLAWVEITHLKKLLKEAEPWVDLMLEDPYWKHLEGKEVMQWKEEVEKLK